MSDESTPNTPANGTPSAPSEALMSNDALLAEMDALGDELSAPPAEKAKPKAKEAKGDEGAVRDASDGDSDDAGAGDAGESESEDGDAASDDGDADEGEEDQAEESSGEPEDDKPDPVAAKRIEAIQKAEKESKVRLQQERAEAERVFDQRRAEFEREWRPRVEKAEKVQKLLDRAHVDPVALADERGWDKETKLYIAEPLYRDAKGDDDPKNRQYRAEQMRHRETASKTGELEKQLTEMKSKFEQLERSQRAEKETAKAATLVSDKTPVLQNMLRVNPEKEQSRLRDAINFIREQTGRDPDLSEVVTQLEEVEAETLRAYGIDPTAAFGKPKTKPVNPTDTKTKAQEAGERKTAKTVKNGTNKPPPNAPPTRDQLLKELEDLERN